MTSKSLACCLLLVSIFASAQAATVFDSGKHFRTLGAGARLPTSPIYYSQNNKDIQVQLSDVGRSKFYDAEVPSPVVFYMIKTDPMGKPIHVPVGEADLSAAGNLALLIFLDNPAAPGTYQIDVLPDDLEAFPMGTYQAINDSALPVRVMLAGKSVDVAPGTTKVIPLEISTGRKTFVADFLSMENNVPSLIYADTWGYNPRVRTLIMLHPDKSRARSVSLGRLSESIESLLSKDNLPAASPSSAASSR